MFSFEKVVGGRDGTTILILVDWIPLRSARHPSAFLSTSRTLSIVFDPSFERYVTSYSTFKLIKVRKLEVFSKIYFDNNFLFCAIEGVN